MSSHWQYNLGCENVTLLTNFPTKDPGEYVAMLLTFCTLHLTKRACELQCISE